MAEPGIAIVELYQRIQQLKNHVGGNGQDKPSEIFRCWGLIQWILKLEGNRIFEILEDRQFAEQVGEGLFQAMEDVNQADIISIRVPKDPEMVEENLPEFHKYLELPGPVVRQTILSFLGSVDLLNMARAKPTEAKYFETPLHYLQMEAVFPLLMERNLLDKVDINNLVQVNSFFKTFVVKHFENVALKDNEYFNDLVGSPSSVTFVNELSLDQGNYPFCHPVGIKLCEKLDSTTSLLQAFGNRILHLHFTEPETEEISPEVLLHRIASCLHLTPNLKALSLRFADMDVPATSPESLPALPSLKSLFVEGEPDCELPFLRKYAEQLEWLHINTDIRGGVSPEYPVLSEGSSLNSLHLDQGRVIGYPLPLLPPVNIFGNFAASHIKVLVLTAFQEPLHQLLSTVGNHWGNTLESLELQTLNALLGMPYFFLEAENSIWMLNLRFPKLKRLYISDYPLIMPWGFLLLFPALEELRWEDNDPGLLETVGPERIDPEYMIQLYSDRVQMLSSNIWKLFPQLGKLDIGFDRMLTRSECVAFQNRSRAQNQQMEGVD